jgi:transformation/transcription domain-associated protein
MPEMGFTAQVPLLQTFQQLVELRESGRVLVDVHQQPSLDRQYSDTKDVLETWK